MPNLQAIFTAISKANIRYRKFLNTEIKEKKKKKSPFTSLNYPDNVSSIHRHTNIPEDTACLD